MLRGVVKDAGGFDYLQHEGALAGGLVVYGADAGEDPIGDTVQAVRAGASADVDQQLK